MKRPAIPRAFREAQMSDIRRFRAEVDCQWPRRSGRPRCGRCFACDMVVVVELAGATVH